MFGQLQAAAFLFVVVVSVVDCIHLRSHAVNSTNPNNYQQDRVLNNVSADADIDAAYMLEATPSNHSDFDIKEAKSRVLSALRESVSKVSPIKSPGAWMIVDGKLYLTEDEHNAVMPVLNSKLMVGLVTSILANTCGNIPDVTFNMISGSMGTNITDFPELAIARKPGGRNDTTHGGILVPNPYFLGVRAWQKKTDKLIASSDSVPWSEKINKAFWRGRTWKEDGFADGNRERFESSQFSDRRPDMFDVKLNTAKAHKQDQLKYCMNKFLVNLPGGRRGSYSRNLNHLWTTGSVVVQWESEAGKGLNYEEWYYPALQKNVTHLEVGAHNAVEMLNAYKFSGGDKAAQKIGARDLSIHNAFLCPCCLSKHFITTFRMLAKKLDFSPRDELAQNPGRWLLQKPIPPEQGSDSDCVCNA